MTKDPSGQQRPAYCKCAFTDPDGTFVPGEACAVHPEVTPQREARTSKTDLMRYGIKWNGPREPIATPMEDGYWTPWHIANAEIERLQNDRNECLEAFHILFRIFPEPK